MNFEPSIAQTVLKNDVRDFASRHGRADGRIVAFRARSAASQDHWSHFAKHGWLGVAVPAIYGGRDGGVAEIALIAHELGRALIVTPYTGSAVMAAQAMLAVASAPQLERFLPRLVTGDSRMALAYSEPQSRGMPEPILLRAERAPDGYLLDGCKTLVLGGPEADLLIVSAVTADQAVLLLVDADAPGVTATVVELHDASRAAHFIFDGVFVPDERVLATGRAAIDGLRLALAYGTVSLCAELVGVMERAIELTAQYLKARTQFGRPIGKFQALQHRMADMATEMELSRSMLLALMAAIEDGDNEAVRRLASQTKSLVSRAATTICGQAIQMHGGVGVTDACPIGRYFKRAMVADILLGSSDSHNDLRARDLEATLKTAESRWYELLPVWWSAQNRTFAE